MKEILLVALGGILSIGGGLANSFVISRKQQKQEAARRKIEVYSKFNELMSRSFLQEAKVQYSSSVSEALLEFELRLGASMGPARMIASTKMAEAFRIHYELEVENMKLNLKDKDSNFSEQVIRNRHRLESMMKEDIEGKIKTKIPQELINKLDEIQEAKKHIA